MIICMGFEKCVREGNISYCGLLFVAIMPTLLITQCVSLELTYLNDMYRPANVYYICQTVTNS